jgi:hypothetical protein
LHELLSNPAVQGGAAPFAVALLVAIALAPFRLAGLALIAGFAVCMHLVSGIQITPLTATRKILIVALGAAALGPAVDFAFRPKRVWPALLALAAAVGALWVFWPVIVQRGGQQSWAFGGVTALGAALAVGTAHARLAGDGVRAGAATLALGLGTGVAAFLAASLSYALYGVAIGAAAGAFLLPQMVRNRTVHAGATFLLPAVVTGMLIANGAMLLAQLPWYCVLLLALTPLAASLPGPKGAAWLQAVVCSLYGFLVAALACVLAWPSSSST